MTVTITLAPCPSCPVVDYESWDCWRAVQQGGGVFRIIETGGETCSFCWGARQTYYEGFYGWAMLPCLTCLGQGTMPRRIFVRLVERRAIPR